MAINNEINLVLKAVDGISPELQKVSNTLNKTGDKFKSFGVETKKSSKTIDGFESKISELQKALNQTEIGSKQFHNLNTEIKKTQDELDKASASLGSFAERNKGKLKAMVGAGTTALGLLTGAIIKGRDSMVEWESVTNRYLKLSENVSGETKEQAMSTVELATAIEKQGVASKESVLNAAAQLRTFDMQKDAIEKLLPAITDYVIAEKGATASTGDFQSMTNGLAQALNGNFQSLTAQGFVLDDASKALLTNGTEMERAAVLAEILDSTYKGMNKSVSETAEGIKILRSRELGTLFENISKLFPVFEQFDKIILGITTSINNWITENPKLAKTILMIGTVLSGALVVFGAVGLALAPIISGFTAFALAIKTVSAVLVASPIGLILGAIAVAGYLIYKNWGKIKPALEGILPSFEQIQNFFTAVKEKIDGFITGITDAKDALVGWFSNNFGESFGNLKTTVGEAWDGILQIFSRTEAIEDGKNTINNANNEITGAFAKTKEAIRGIFIENEEDAQKWAEFWEKTKEQILNTIAGVIDIFIGLATQTAIIIKGMVNVIDGIIKVFAGLIKGDTNLIKEGVLKVFNSLWVITRDIFNNGIKTIISIVSRFSPELGAQMKSAMENMKAIIAGYITQAKDWGSNMIKMFQSGVMGKLNSFKESITGVANTIKSVLGFASPTDEGPASNSDKWMPNMMNMFIDGINKEKPKFSSAVTEIAETIQASMGKIEMDGVLANYEANYEGVANVLGKLKGEFNNTFRDIESSISGSENKIKSLRSEIENLQGKLGESQNKSQDSEDNTKVKIAERLIAIQDELANNELEWEKRLLLEKELAQGKAIVSEKEIYDIKQQRLEEASRTEIEKMILAESQRQMNFAAEQSRIQQDIFAKKEALLKEEEQLNKLNEQKTTFEQNYHKLYLENITKRNIQTEKAIRMQERLIALMKESGSYSGGGNTISGARATGGPVTGGSTYLVGERGPELFTPRQSGQIVPNNQLGGAPNISINMGGVTVQNEADENRLLDKMKKMIIMETRNYNLGIS